MDHVGRSAALREERIMKAIVSAVAVLALLAPAAAYAEPAFDQGAIVKIKGKGKGKGKGHWKHHGRERDWYDDDWDERRAYRRGYRDGRHSGYRPGYSYGYGYDQGYHWSRGQVLPYEYRRYPVYNYHDYGWAPPPRGHAYYRTSTGDIILAAIATGIIVSILTR
jgi:Ni/Co efflux regulator RcnB